MPLVDLSASYRSFSADKIWYMGSDLDESDSSTKYYGFVSERGKWYIIKMHESSGVTTIRYAWGKTDYSTNWTNRASLYKQEIRMEKKSVKDLNVTELKAEAYDRIAQIEKLKQEVMMIEQEIFIRNKGVKEKTNDK